MDKIGSNSYKKEDEQPRSFVTKPITNDVEPVRPVKDTIIDIFLGDAIRNLQHRNPIMVVLRTYIAPKIIDGIFEFAEEMFYGNRNGRRRTTNMGTPYTSYSMYGNSRPASRRPVQDDVADQDIYEDYRYFTLSDRGVAEEVLLEMQTIIKDNGFIRVGDLYRMFNKTPKDYQMWAYGWTADDIEGVRPKIVRGGRWSLNLPEPRKLR